MGVLRLICLASGLSAIVAFAPGSGRAQVEAAGISAAEVPTDLTSGGVAADVVADMPSLGTEGGPVLVQEPEEQVSALAPAQSLRPVLRDAWAVPEARWDDHPNGARWTSAVLAALRGPGAALLESEPRDIRAWCPGYLDASPAQRAAFWTGLISSLAWHESTYRPGAVGGGGQWYGLVQIAPGTARWRDCDVGSGEALLNGAANLRCGIRIMAITVPRDDVVSEGMRGVAADWGPFHSARKLEDMRNWVRDQSYCAPPPRQSRPVMRPAGLGEAARLSAPPVLADVSRGNFRPLPRP